jgi:hypothetical protein
MIVTANHSDFARATNAIGHGAAMRTTYMNQPMLSADPFVLFGQDNSRAAHFRREVLELGQPIPYGQHPLGVIDVKGGRECHTRYRRGINVHHAQRWMVGHEMTAAFRAVLPVAQARFHEVTDQTGARRDGHVFGLPQGERIHRRGRPRSARIAMAIPHRLRRSVHFDFDSSAEAAPLMCHHIQFHLLHCSAEIYIAAVLPPASSMHAYEARLHLRQLAIMSTFGLEHVRQNLNGLSALSPYGTRG